MRVILYQTKSDDRYLYKKLVTLANLSRGFELKANCDMENPSLRFSKKTYSEVSKINYCYISTFKRFYFVKNITLESDGIYSLECEVDVLMSFQDSIKSILTLITRQEKVYSNYIVDEKLPVKCTRLITYKTIGASPFTASLSNASQCVALTVTGGGVSE